MTRTFILYFAIAYCIAPIGLSAQDWKWGRVGGAPDTGDHPNVEVVMDMVTDVVGNVYVASRVNEGAIKVDGKEKAGYGNIDIMVSSFTCDGTHRWTRVIGGPADDIPRAITVDKSGGVYLAAYIDLYQPGTIGNIEGGSLIPNSLKTIYLIKFDDLGSFQWFRTPLLNAATYADRLYTDNIDLSVSPKGEIYWMCKLKAGTYGASNSYVANTDGTYVLKYNLYGDFKGAIKIDATFNGATGMFARMARNHNNNTYYVAGRIYQTSGTVVIDSILSGTMYTAKFDSSGNLIWLHQNKGNSSIYYPGIEGRPALDSVGNLYVAGRMFPNTNFNGHTLKATTGRAFVMAMDPNGKEIWSKSSSDVGRDSWATNIALRNSGEVWITGHFADSMQWSGYDSILVAPPPGLLLKTFIARFSSHTGKVLALNAIWDAPYNCDYNHVLASDVRSNIFVGGIVWSSAEVGNLTFAKASGSYDWFVAKYGYTCNCQDIPKPKFSFTRLTDKIVSYNYTGTQYSNITWDFGDGKTSTQPNPTHNYVQNSFYQACVTVTNSCGDNIYCQNIFLWPVGTKEVETVSGEVKIYPNPANEYLYVEGAAAGMKLIIQNTLGQVLYNGIVNSSKEVINISQYVPGSYVLQLIGSDGSRSVVKLEKL